jgi:metallophosphoesterase superfamily enzyme
MKLQVAGEELLLLPQKAVYWPRAQMLIVADIHFGKAASFRALGVPVPAGTTSANLLALDELLALHPVRHILSSATSCTRRRRMRRHAGGDAGLAPAPSATAADAGARQSRRHAGDPPPQLDIAMVDEPYLMGPFAFCHHPDVLSAAYVLAGHVHPVYRLRAGWESLLLPCFLASPQRMVLPSFGAFTGGHAVLPQPGERVFVSSGEAVWEIPL